MLQLELRDGDSQIQAHRQYLADSKKLVYACPESAASVADEM